MLCMESKSSDGFSFGAQSLSQTLKKGDTGKDVRELKGALAHLRYISYEAVNGVFDFNCKESLRLFQEDNGLSATGEFDDQTRRALNKALAAKG